MSSLAVNEPGLTFAVWHEQAGYTIQWMSRCAPRWFSMLHRAWREGDDPADWKGAVKVIEQHPWD